MTPIALDDPPPVDVNDAFLEGRQQQIAWLKDAPRRAAEELERQRDWVQKYNTELDQRVAAGTLIDLGNGRYRINEPGNFDDGEVLARQRVRDAAGFVQEVVLPEHGLEQRGDKVSLYFNADKPMWHHLGQSIPGGTTDVDLVLQLAGLNHEIYKTPVLFVNRKTNKIEVLPDAFVTGRDDLEAGAGLGVVGNVFTPFQARSMMNFLMELVAKHGVTWESAGVLRGGKKSFACLRLPTDVVIDEQGINDRIEPYLAGINDHSGQGTFRVIATPWRIGCGNTERFAVRDAITSWEIRHTTGIDNKVEQARETLKLSLSYYDQWVAEQQQLARTELALREFEKTIKDVFGELKEDAGQRAKTNVGRRNSILHQLWDENTAQLGRTAYAAERTVTQYADWKISRRPGKSFQGDLLAARATMVLEGSDAELKNRTHKRLMTLVRR
jgi:phage/plasmid-like protein (TIGR03299 family)